MEKTGGRLLKWILEVKLQKESEREGCGIADERGKYSGVKENKMEGCNREVIVKAGWRQIAPRACFLLIQIRFHKDPHDCLITRGAQRGMRRRGKAGHDETDK